MPNLGLQGFGRCLCWLPLLVAQSLIEQSISLKPFEILSRLFRFRV